MGPKRFLIATLFFLLFLSCDDLFMICSLNPYYVEKNIVLEPSFEGQWKAKQDYEHPDTTSTHSSYWDILDTTSTWNIHRFIKKESLKNRSGKDSVAYKPENYYTAKLSNNSDTVGYSFKVVLFKINQSLYADFILINKDAILKSKMASGSFLEVHTLARVTFFNQQVFLSWMGTECMKDMIEKKRVRIKYSYVNELNRLILSASSEDLTEMIEKYGDQSRFIDWNNQQSKLVLNHNK